MLRIVVDDERTFKGEPDIVYLRNSKDALAFLSRVWTEFYMNYGDPVHELWLDHDLGLDDDIRIVAQFLYVTGKTDKPFPVYRVYVHSMNGSGADWVYDLIRHAGYPVERVALPKLLDEVARCPFCGTQLEPTKSVKCLGCGKHVLRRKEKDNAK